jgi:hypothetical protein
MVMKRKVLEVLGSEYHVEVEVALEPARFHIQDVQSRRQKGHAMM